MRFGNPKCLNLACAAWEEAEEKGVFETAVCSTCGFNEDEAARREKIPLEQHGKLKYKTIRRGTDGRVS